MVYGSFWRALSRYAPDAFAELLQELHTSREAVESAAAIPRPLSEVPLKEFLGHLYTLKSYPSIARLAGQMAYAQSPQHNKRFRRLMSPSSRMRAVVSQSMEQLSALMPEIDVRHPRRSSGHILHLRGLPFVVSGLGRPTCGFVCGFVGAALTMNGIPGLRVGEESCMSANDALKWCVFEVGGVIVESQL